MYKISIGSNRIYLDDSILDNNSINQINNTIDKYNSIRFSTICVTLAAIIFYDTTILYWYVLGALMEIFHKFPSKQLDKDDRVNLDYRRHYEKDFTDYRR